jgi:hypothetical protein
MIGAQRAGNKRKQLILSSTPQRVGTFFENSFDDPDYYKITVGWDRAVKANRLNYDTVMKAKQNMTKIQFQNWYEASFADQGEDSVFDMEEVRRNIVPQDKTFYGERILSVDVARMGRDSTVYCIVDLNNGVYRVVDMLTDFHKDLMSVTGKIVALNNAYKFKKLFVDASGLGAGVFDRLREQGVDAIAITAGSKCTNKDAEKDCLNLKSELFMRAKMLFEQDKLKIIDSGTLLKEIRAMRKEYTSNGQVKILDPDDKSPDYLDSLVYSLYAPVTGKFVMIDFSHSANKVKGFAGK